MNLRYIKDNYKIISSFNKLYNNYFNYSTSDHLADVEKNIFIDVKPSLTSTIELYFQDGNKISIQRELTNQNNIMIIFYTFEGNTKHRLDIDINEMKDIYNEYINGNDPVLKDWCFSLMLSFSDINTYIKQVDLIKLIYVFSTLYYNFNYIGIKIHTITSLDAFQNVLEDIINGTEL